MADVEQVQGCHACQGAEKPGATFTLAPDQPVQWLCQQCLADLEDSAENGARLLSYVNFAMHGDDEAAGLTMRLAKLDLKLKGLRAQADRPVPAYA